MLTNYFRIAWRNLIRNRSYAFINILGLALSMTCGIIIFLLVQYHLSFDDFHQDPDRVYRIVTEQHRDNISYAASVPSPFGKAFREDYAFAEKTGRVATFENEQVTVRTNGEIKKFKELAGFAFAEPEYFSIFNYPLVKGDQQNLLTAPNTAIITEKLALKYFGKDDPMNQTITLANKFDCTITGVLKDLPANTDQETQIFVSYANLKDMHPWLARDDSWGGMTGSMRCYTKLKPGVSAAQVEAVLPEYVKKYRAGNKNVHHYKLQPLSAIHFDARYGGSMEKENLWILSFIGLFLIITACVNFVNLATAQALKRSKEVGIRKVIGGMRYQLFWQFIGETAMITLAAALFALALSQIALPYLNTWLGASLKINLPGSWTLALFLLSLIIVVTFFAGAYPGLVLSGFRPIAAIKGKLSQQELGGFNTRRALIVTQFTISLILIIGMIVIASQVRYSKQTSMGFDKDAIVVVPVGKANASSVQSLKTRLAAAPGVEKISLCFEPPSSRNNWNTTVTYDNRAENETFPMSVKSADDKYLETFDLQLAAGRNLFPADTTREILINETMVKKLGLSSPQEAIGKNIIFNQQPPIPVVGVLKDFHNLSFHEDIGAVGVMIEPKNYDNYAIKINKANVPQTLAAIEKTWSQTYPDQVYEYEFLDDRIAGFYETEAFMLQAIGIFSILAIFIGCLGLYGLVAFMVAQKTREIGIRKILGSSPGQLIWLFGREFSRLILLSFVIAAPLSWWLMNKWLKNFEYRIDFSVWIFVIALACIAIIAAITVGYRTAKVAFSSPVNNLRSE